MQQITDKKIEEVVTRIADNIIRDYPATRLAQLLNSLDKEEKITLLLENHSLIDQSKRLDPEANKKLLLTVEAAEKMLHVLGNHNRRAFAIGAISVGAASLVGGAAHNFIRGGEKNMGQIERITNHSLLTTGVSMAYIGNAVSKKGDWQRIPDLAKTSIRQLFNKITSLEDENLATKNYVDAIEPRLKKTNYKELVAMLDTPELKKERSL